MPNPLGGEDDFIQEIIAYSVTSTLSHCTASNSAATVTAGGTYSNTLTPDEGYYFGAGTGTQLYYSVKMAGETVSTSFDDGAVVVSIPEVSGDIVIITSTTQIPDTPVGT